jgi:hypothetical protein
MSFAVVELRDWAEFTRSMINPLTRPVSGSCVWSHTPIAARTRRLDKETRRSSSMAWIRNRPVGLVHRDAALCEDGYTLFCPIRGTAAWLLDPEGRFVHRWYHPEGIQHAKLLANGNLLIQTQPPNEAEGCELIGGSADAMIELDWGSQVVWEYRDPFQHHDYQRKPNGNTVLLRWERLPEDVWPQVRGGDWREDDPQGMWGDVVREIGPDGTTIGEWRSWEYLDFESDMLCPLDEPREWTHANSLALLADGRWLISFRLTSTVAIVDPSTGKFDWKWGPGKISHQHAASELPNGHILLFNNGCHRSRGPSYSEVVEVDPASDEVVWTYRAKVALAFYSFMVSGAERLASGNTFITEGATGRLFEVTPEGETVWEWVSPFSLIDLRFGPTPAIFRAHRYCLDDPRLASHDLDPRPYRELQARIERDGELPTGEEGG